MANDDEHSSGSLTPQALATQELTIDTDGFVWQAESVAGQAGASTEVKLILAKAASLARDLNHKECHLAHVMHAITLFPAARDRFKLCHPPLDTIKVREATWRELSMIGVLSETPKRVGVSKDVRDLHDYVQELVRPLYDPSNRTIHVKDLIEAIVSGPLSQKVRDNYSGQPTVPTPEETRITVRDTRWALDQYMPRIQGWLGELRQTIGGTPTLAVPATVADPVLVPGLVESVRDFRAESRVAHEALHHQLVALQVSNARIEKKVRNTRYLAIAILLMMTVVASVAAVSIGVMALARPF
jgi:hypothetical protein